jgi:hypothetical protein
MSKIISGTFTHYELTTKEILAGSILTTDQKAVLQNELATIAESRLNIDFDALNPTKFAQDEAFLKGQMSILRVMLLRSDESEIQLRSLSNQPQN